MNVELLKELMEEILNENKEINKELQSLKSEFSKPGANRDEVLEKLSKIKIHKEIQDINKCLYNSKSEITEIIRSGITNLTTERQIFIKVATSWKKAIIHFFNLSVISVFIYLIVLLIGKYFMPVVKENLKFKNAYEYVYYDNGGSQDYLQEVILLFDDKKTKEQLRQKTSKQREESQNPLVFSK